MISFYRLETDLLQLVPLVEWKYANKHHYL